MMNRSNKLISLLALMALLGLGLAGCSDDDDDNPMGPEMNDKAMLRVVHASPDAPAVDIYVNDGNEPLIEGLAYGETSTRLEVDAATYTVQLRGEDEDATTEPVFEVDLTLANGQTVTAIAAGFLGSTDAADRFRVLPMVEDFGATSGGIRARIVHASPDAPTVAVDVANDGSPEVTGFERFADTGAAGVALPAGENLRIGIWAGSPLGRAATFTTPALPAGSELFVIATGRLAGDPDSDGFSLLAVGPTGSVGFIRQDAKAMVYALHGSPDAPAVDIDAGGVEVVANLAFAELSDGLEVWPGAYGLDFRATGDTQIAASATVPYLEPGRSYLAIATGFLSGSPQFQLLPVDESFADPGAMAGVRVVHASPDAPPVDVGTVQGGKVSSIADFSGLGFGATSPAAGTPLPVGTLPIGIAPAGEEDAVVEFEITTTAGLRAYAVALGSLGGTGESFRLALVVVDDSGWSVATVMPNP